jgi:hypothetical protein
MYFDKTIIAQLVGLYCQSGLTFHRVPTVTFKEDRQVVIGGKTETRTVRVLRSIIALGNPQEAKRIGPDKPRKSSN